MVLPGAVENIGAFFLFYTLQPLQTSRLLLSPADLALFWLRFRLDARIHWGTICVVSPSKCPRVESIIFFSFWFGLSDSANVAFPFFNQRAILHAVSVYSHFTSSFHAIAFLYEIFDSIFSLLRLGFPLTPLRVLISALAHQIAWLELLINFLLLLAIWKQSFYSQVSVRANCLRSFEVCVLFLLVSFSPLFALPDFNLVCRPPFE